MSIGEPGILWQETLSMIEARAAIRKAEDEEARRRGDVILRGWIPPQRTAWSHEAEAEVLLPIEESE
jgi:hypothetical protein